eukprot:1624351-Karenia_brevis.AAC.1
MAALKLISSWRGLLPLCALLHARSPCSQLLWPSQWPGRTIHAPVLGRAFPPTSTRSWISSSTVDANQGR